MHSTEPVISNTPDPNRDLRLATIKRDLESAGAILASGADINASDSFGWTPLMIAAKNGSTELVQLLLTSGADPNRENSTGATALYLAVKRGHIDIVELLVASG